MTTDTQNSEWYESKAWPTVISTNDYYPFGLQMAGRKMDNVDYRYGFNGKEIDNWNAKGEAPPSGGGPPGPPPAPNEPVEDPNSGIVYDYGFRIYNPTIAKFLSVDPLAPDYPELTPYQFASNTPINSIDLDGLEQLVSVTMEGSDKAKFYAISDEDGRKAVETQFWTIFKSDLDPSNFVWTKGENEYKRNGSVYAPLFGTLHVDVKSDKTYLSFDPTPHSRIDSDFSIIDGYQKFRHTFRGNMFEETMINYVSIVISAPASGYINISKGFNSMLNTAVGKGLFDAFGQGIVKGSFTDIDIADAAASAIIKNSYVKDFTKAMIDFSIGETNEKDFIERMLDFGLRVRVSKATNELKNQGGASKYIIDLASKRLRKEIVETAKETVGKE